MNKVKGIVVEQNKDHVVILTPDGQFLRGEAEGQAIGSEILVSHVRSKSRLQLSARKPIAAAALLAAVLLILLSVLFLPFREPALAFIQLEVNPAIEFGIDSEGRVRELTPLNDDGSAMIREFGEWDGKNVNVLLFRIFTEYGKADRKLTVTSVKPADGKLTATVEETVQFIEETAGEEGMLLKVTEADQELRERAMTEGVPISRLINQDIQSGEPSSAEKYPKETEDTDKPEPADDMKSPAENKHYQKGDVLPDQDTLPKAKDKESVQPPGSSGQAPGIRKKETSPPEFGTQGKPQKHSRPEKTGQQKGPSGKNSNGNPSENTGQGKKNSSSGHTGRDQQSGPAPKGKSDENPGGNQDSPPGKQNSPGHGHPSNKGQQNKNSGNGNGGNGNGPGN